jgi:hypothetical protein
MSSQVRNNAQEYLTVPNRKPDREYHYRVAVAKVDGVTV